MSFNRDYTPYPYQRFKISDDKYSQERIQFLSAIRQQIEKDWGLPIGFVVYGSLTKGKRLTKETAHKADIDFSIFILIDNVDVPNLLDSMGVSGDVDEIELLKNAIKQAVKLALCEKGFLPSQLDNIWAYAVSQSELQKSILELQPQLKDWSQDELRKEFVDNLLWRPLIRLFYLDVGNRLNPFKVELLEYLKTLGDYGEIIWDLMIQLVKNQERQDNISYQVAVEYPDTLDEALRKYRSNDWMIKVE